jgi:hypothetical protein
VREIKLTQNSSGDSGGVEGGRNQKTPKKLRLRRLSLLENFIFAF